MQKEQILKNKNTNLPLSLKRSVYINTTDIKLAEGKKIFFASDFHFGIPDYETSRKRETLVCSWLDSIKNEAQQIYLLGDMFDSWMEYKKVVPKGNVRFLGKLAELSDAGIEIVAFTGNHDLWMHGYFEKELHIPVYKNHITITVNAKKIHMGHGDGIGKGDTGYKILKKILNNPICQWLYSTLHPNVGLALADYFSRKGPKHKYEELELKTDDKEYQIQYSIDFLKNNAIDYFIFGHRHIPYQKQITPNSQIVNLGDWITHNTYAVFDGETLVLQKY